MLSTRHSRVRRTALSLAFAASFSWLPQWAQAQTFPVKPVSIVVSYPAGGVADLLARSVGQALSKVWGQPVVVENKPGANQTIAAVAVSKALPDGHTLLLCDNGAFTLNPHLYNKLAYGLKDFVPIAGLADVKLVLSMTKQIPADDFKGMVAYAKAHPGQLNYASLGTGNITHLLLETMKRDLKIDLVHIPYKGYAEAINDVLSNQAQLVSGAIGGPILGHLRKGSLKALAITGTSRSPLIPDVPTFAELGYPTINPKVQFILVGPAGIPAPVVAQINDAVQHALKDVTASVLGPNGLEPLSGTPKELELALVAEHKAYAALVKEVGIRLD